jgi:hypothetical protein
VGPEELNEINKQGKRKVASDRSPWQRQPGESAVAYEAFMTYLMLGPERTQQKAGDSLGKSRKLMEDWARQWAWSLRCAMYEEHFLLKRLESIEVARDEMFDKHMVTAQTAMDLLGDHFQFLMSTKDPVTGEIKALKGDTAVRLFDVAAKVGRMALEGKMVADGERRERVGREIEEQAEALAEFGREFLGELDLPPEEHAKAMRKLKKVLVGVSEDESD